jgi:hypothetical protein
MKVTLESTESIVHVQTRSGVVPARVWEGTTEGGIPVVALVTRIVPAVENPSDDVCKEFANDLSECRPPTPIVDAIFPARLLL